MFVFHLIGRLYKRDDCMLLIFICYWPFLSLLFLFSCFINIICCLICIYNQGYIYSLSIQNNDVSPFDFLVIIELILSSYLKSSNTRLNSNILWLCLILLLFLLNDTLIYNFLGTSCFQPFLAWVSHVEQEILFLPENTRSPPDLCGVRVARSLPCCVMFWGSLFVLLFFFCWPLCCLSFFIKSFLQITSII